MNATEALREAFSLIDGLPVDIADFRGAVPEHIVERAEAILGVRLPESYRSYVLKYGQGSVGSYEFLGLIPSQLDPTEASQNFLTKTIGNRKFGLPSTMIAFYNLGNGEDYVLDTSEAEPMVRAWSAGVGGDRSRMDVVHQDFPGFLLDLVQQAVEEAKEEGLSLER